MIHFPEFLPFWGNSNNNLPTDILMGFQWDTAAADAGSLGFCADGGEVGGLPVCIPCLLASAGFYTGGQIDWPTSGPHPQPDCTPIP